MPAPPLISRDLIDSPETLAAYLGLAGFECVHRAPWDACNDQWTQLWMALTATGEFNEICWRFSQDARVDMLLSFTFRRSDDKLVIASHFVGSVHHLSVFASSAEFAMLLIMSAPLLIRVCAA